jgi:DNA topoisomerase-6 subunit A
VSTPDAKYLGLRSIDFERCGLSNSVQIRLNDNDRKRAKQIANYPWFEDKPKLQKEIKKLLDNDFKLEVEALISKTRKKSSHLDEVRSRRSRCWPNWSLG